MRDLDTTPLLQGSITGLLTPMIFKTATKPTQLRRITLTTFSKLAMPGVKTL